MGCGCLVREIAPVFSPGLRSVGYGLLAMCFVLEGVVPVVLRDSKLLTLSVWGTPMLWLQHVDTALFVCMLHLSLGSYLHATYLHATVEDCHSIRFLMNASRYFPVVDVRYFDFAMVAVAVAPDGVLTTTLD